MTAAVDPDQPVSEWEVALDAINTRYETAVAASALAAVAAETRASIAVWLHEHRDLDFRDVEAGGTIEYLGLSPHALFTIAMEAALEALDAAVASASDPHPTMLEPIDVVTS